MEELKLLKELVERRKEVGARNIVQNGDYKSYYEFKNIGEQIISEVCRLYETGQLN
ncbi:MAG: hypothetical protein K0R23_210 [Lacrimispora sp.]|nr:hypothetical protein [Lacrimispora sp.]